MNQQNHTSVYHRFRVRSKSLLRDNKLLILAELIIALLIMLAYLTGFIPLSETPYLLLLGWLSLWLRGIGWRAVGLKRPARWRNTLLVGIAVGVVYQFFSLYWARPQILAETFSLNRSLSSAQQPIAIGAAFYSEKIRQCKVAPAG